MSILTKVIHVCCSAARDSLRDVFVDLILLDQDCFASLAGWQELLQLIADRAVVSKLEEEWTDDSSRTSEEKWADLKGLVRKYEKNSPQRVRSRPLPLYRY